MVCLLIVLCLFGIIEANSNITNITTSNYKKTIGSSKSIIEFIIDTKWLILFYSESSINCSKLMPVWEALPNKTESYSDISIGMVNM